MIAKQVYDMRGRQSSMLRVGRFDKGALLHMLSNRILAVLALVGAAVMFLDLYSPSYLLAYWARIMIIVIWIFFTPQLFSVFKAFSLVYSKGAAFGHLNRSFLNVGVKKKGIHSVYTALPYAAVVVWLLGFVALAVLWFA